MRISLCFVVLGATLVLGAAAMALPTDASAAIRRSRSGAQTVPAPAVNQNDPYFSYGTGRRDVHPSSGTPRWNGGGGPG